MRIWLALLVAPSLALACQSILFAMVTPSCSMQTSAGLHLVSAGTLALTGVFTILAQHERRMRADSSGLTEDSDSADPSRARRFLATVATAVGVFSCLAIGAMWINVWVLSPCWQ
ncbi:MAG: hypothetical protein M3150_03615 [Pseudomonadota bacterium]|nr:hypothetical protein [Pseudomonadota bacterium]